MIMRQKKMDREVTKHIWKNKRKEKQEKQARKWLTMLIVAKKLAKRELVKQQRANFIVAWSSLVIREVVDIFHYNFNASLRPHLLGYMGVNLGSITHVHK